MTALGIIGIIFLSLLAVVLVSALILMIKGRQMLKEFYPDKTMKQIIDEGNYQEENVPKTVSNATNIFLNRIHRDFPEFVWHEWRANIESVLKSALTAISNQNIDDLSEFAGYNIKKMIELEIADDEREGVSKKYTDITIYQTEIVKYDVGRGLCTITAESSVSYYTWHTRDGKIIYGSQKRKVQTRYYTYLSYIQDYDMVMKRFPDNGFGLSCPTCGAPIKMLGQKHCDYCGREVVEISAKVWRVTEFKERKISV